MEEQLISFETAKLATEKGFNEESLYFYTKPNSKMFGIDEHGRSFSIKNTSKKLYQCGSHAALNTKNVYFAPTQSLLKKWLRKKYHIHIEVEPKEWNNKTFKWRYSIGKMETINDPRFSDNVIYDVYHSNYEFYNSYEAALEKALYEVLKSI